MLTVMIDILWVAIPIWCKFLLFSKYFCLLQIKIDGKPLDSEEQVVGYIVPSHKFFNLLRLLLKKYNNLNLIKIPFCPL